jgi:hypothetical protein
VVEAGFSENYENLVADARLWLEGMPTVNMVLLVKITESPVYISPTQDLKEEDEHNECFKLRGYSDERFCDPGRVWPCDL